MTKIKFCCLILCFRFWGLVSADYVPVLIWGSHIQNEPTLALQFHNGDDFIDVLNGAITPDTVILVITEDQLTVEDLTQCQTENGSCFQGIQQIQDKLYLPNVEDPVPTLEDVAGLDKIEVNILPNGSLSKSLNDNFQSYVFINFEESIVDERTKLTHHDQLVTKLYNELLSKSQRLLVIYTGKRSGNRGRTIREISDSQPTMDEGDKKKVSGIFWQREQFLLYYTSFYVVDAFRNQSIFFDEVAATHGGTGMVGILILVTMRVTESDDYFVFTIIEKNGYWWLNEATWNAEKLFLNRQVSAVHNSSFHCTPSTELATVNRTVVISWKRLQLQPNFNMSKGEPLKKFGDAWDCVYFFSPGIMGGLFVGCMLLFFLFIGILCIMDINTNDRFEKTSQKQLIFNVSE